MDYHHVCAEAVALNIFIISKRTKLVMLYLKLFISQVELRLIPWVKCLTSDSDQNAKIYKGSKQ